MLTYETASEMMKTARNGRRKLANNTYLEVRNPAFVGVPSSNLSHYANPSFAIRLHDTDIIMLRPDGSQTLSSGGWRTVTTKDRLNTYSAVAVWSEKRVWWCAPKVNGRTDWERKVPFRDGLRVLADGTIEA